MAKKVQEKPYSSNVYQALKSKVSGFNLSEDEFNQKLADKAYQQNVYKALKSKVTGFNLAEDDFYNRLSVKKKESAQSVSSQPVQDSGSGSIPQLELVSPEKSDYQQVGDAIGGSSTLSNTPGDLGRAAAKGLYDFGRSLYSTIVDQTPKSLVQSGEVVNAAMEPTSIDEFISNRKPIEFQRYVRERDPKFSGIGGFFTGFNQDEFIDKYGKQFMIDSGYGDKIAEMDAKRPETIRRRLAKEEFVQEQNADSANKLAGTTQRLQDIKSVNDAISYLGTVTGQAAGQIPLSVATRGLSSAVMESAAVYDQQLNEIAEKNNLSRKEVIERNLDRPAAGQSLALLAASLDRLSAGRVLAAFRNGAVRESLGKSLLNVVGEMVTEGAQGNLERYAAKSGAGAEFDPTSKENLMATLDEVIAGGLGGGAFTLAGGVSQFANREKDNTIPDESKNTQDTEQNIETEQSNVESTAEQGPVGIPGQDGAAPIQDEGSQPVAEETVQQEAQAQAEPALTEEQIAKKQKLDELSASGDIEYTMNDSGKATIKVITQKGADELNRLIKQQQQRPLPEQGQQSTSDTGTAQPGATEATVDQPVDSTISEQADQAVDQPKKTFADIEKDLNSIADRNKVDPNAGKKLMARMNPIQVIHSLVDKAQKKVFSKALNFRRFEDTVAKAADKGLKSKNYALRNATGVLKNLIGGLAYTQEGVKNKREFTGLKNYANVYAKQLNDDLHNIVDNNPKSLRLLQMALDPEVYLRENAQYTVLQSEKEALQKSQYGKKAALTNARQAANPDITKIDNLEREIMDIDDKLNDISKQENDIQNQIQQSAIGRLNDNEKTLMQIIRNVNDYGHDWYHDQKLLDDDTYKKNKGKYIARLYEKYELEDPEITQQFNKSRAEFGMLEKRSDFSDVDLEVLRDPVYATAKRVAQMMRTQAIFEYADAIRNSKTIEVSDEPRPGYTQLGQPGGKPYYGSLTGKYVPNYIAEDFKGFFFASKMMDDAYAFVKNYDKNIIRQFLKKANTVYMPLVQLGNFMSNFAFAYVAGVDPITFAQKKIEASKDVKNNGQDYIDLIKAGVIGTDIMQTDIAPILENTSGTGVLGQTQNALREKIMSTKVGQLLDKADKFTTELYGRIDDVSKLAAYKALLQQGYSKQEAIDRVYESFQNYATVGKLYDFAAKTPVIGNPYIKFKADLGRIIKNGITRRPLTTALFLANLYLAKELLSDASVEDEDVKKVRERRPFTPKIKLPSGDISLMWQVPGVGEVNMARFLSPYYNYDLGSRDNYVNSFTDWMPYQFDLADTSPSKDISVPVPEFADVLWGPYAQVAFDRDFRGMSIRDPKGNQFVSLALPEEQITNSLNYIARSQVPLYRSSQDMIDAFTGNLDYYGRQRSITQSLLNNIIKVQEFGSEQAKEQLEKEIVFKISTIEMLEKEIGRITSASEKEISKIEQRNIPPQKKEELRNSEISKMKKRVTAKIDQIKEVQSELEEPAKLLENIK